MAFKTVSISKVCNVTKSQKMLINVFILGLAFMTFFCGYSGTAILQSSVNRASGMGTIALVVLYAALIISNIFLPLPVIRKIGCKWTISLSMLFYVPYVAAQFSPSFASLIPTAISVGLSGATLWCATLTYLITISSCYASVTDSDTNTIIAIVFGIFYGIFETSLVWGNLISSAVLSNVGKKMLENVTDVIDTTKICGVNFCPGNGPDNPNLDRPPQFSLNIVTGIYVALMLFSSLLVAVAIEPLSVYREYDKVKKSETDTSGWKVFIASLRLYKEKHQIFILPLAFLVGFSIAFIQTEYTESFVSCALGIEHVGYVLLANGISTVIFTLLSGWLVKLTNRLVVMSLGFAVQIAITITLMTWLPSRKNEIIFYVLSGVWGISGGIRSQTNSFSGIWFPDRKEQAFCNYMIWESLGFMTLYAINSVICTNIKMYILLAIVILATCSYFALEMSGTPKQN